VGYLAFNMKRKPLDKLEVREALSMAVDRKRILSEIFQGFGVTAKNPIPPMVLGYNPEIPEIPYDPEKAKKLLEKAGVKDLKLDLWAMPVARPYNPNARKMAEFVQADLRKIGVETKIVSYDWGTYLDKASKLEHELGLFGWQGDNGDPDNFLYFLLSKDAALKFPTQNYPYYKSDEFNRLIKEAQIVSDPKKREVLYKKAIEIFAKDKPWLPIAHSLTVVPTRKEVEGYKIDPIGNNRWFASVKFKETP
jgi:ABC-type transport system substrate-binding protein